MIILMLKPNKLKAIHKNIINAIIVSKVRVNQFNILITFLNNIHSHAKTIQLRNLRQSITMESTQYWFLQ